jgi:hypothetical protein
MKLSPEIFVPLSDYLICKSDLGSLRDQMVELRLDDAKCNSLGDDDKLFLREYEGHYAEFSDGLVSEESLRKSLVSLVFPSPVSSPSVVKIYFSFFQEQPSEKPATSRPAAVDIFSAAEPTKNSEANVVPCSA